MTADQNAEFEQFRKPTRRDEFLQTMNAIIPWVELCSVIEPFYPKGVGGRPPIGLERMLGIHFVEHSFNLADVACEEALYDSTSLRRATSASSAGQFHGSHSVPFAFTRSACRCSDCG